MEALQMIYKTSVFCFSTANALHTFVDRVPERYLRIVGNLQVRLTVPTWTQNLLTSQLIRSCILNSLPGLLHFNMRIIIAQDSSPFGRREICTIEEQLLSSTMLPQLKSANLELIAYSRSLMVEAMKALARNDFYMMRHLIIGPVA